MLDVFSHKPTHAHKAAIYSTECNHVKEKIHTKIKYSVKILGGYEKCCKYNYK